MKKVLFILAVGAFALSSCNPKKTADAAQTDSTQVVADSVTNDSLLTYEGTIPAADGPGIRYVVKLTKDNPARFEVEETYLEAENGKDKTYNYKGVTETETEGGKTALKLALESDHAIYLKKVDDTTYRMVNDELEEPAGTGLNYDLKLRK